MAHSPEPKPADETLAPPLAALLGPFQRFASTEAAGGLVLLASALVALVWANSPWWPSYEALWSTPLTVGIGQAVLTESLHTWINDGLMAIFFFVVGLEIRREITAGELAERTRALLPVAAAFGGMIVPAALYFALNRGGPGAHGWGIPMATDIAFSLGILALVGGRAPVGLKVFMSALAIVDDLGAVLVIALFYSGGLVWPALFAAGALFLVGVVCGRLGARSPVLFFALGVLIWLALFASGLHATLAGIVAAAMIPASTRIDSAAFLRRGREALDRFEAAAAPGGNGLANHQQRAALQDLELAAEHSQSPMMRLETILLPWVAFGIVPLFALANAGVRVVGGGLVPDSAVTWGVVVGLVLGKPLGVVGFSLLALRSGRASLPDGVTRRHLFGAGVLAGVGFTMSLFIAGLAFDAPVMVEEAKAGILLGSAVAGIAGWWILKGAPEEARRTGGGQEMGGSLR